MRSTRLTLLPPDGQLAHVLPVGDPGVSDPGVADPQAAPVPDVLGDVLGAVLASAATGGPFTTLARLMQTADLAALPVGLGQFTLFAPTDRAFGRLGDGEVDALAADPARLARVLTHHLVPRAVTAPRAGAPVTVRSVAGDELTVSVTGTTFRVNGARIVVPHIHTPNGTVRAIDGVLMP